MKRTVSSVPSRSSRPRPACVTLPSEEAKGETKAPVTSTCYVLINRAAPAGRSTEAFGWSITATVAGAGLGAAIGGAIVNGGHVSGGFLAAFVAVALAAAVAYARRQTLASTAFGMSKDRRR